MLSLSAKLSMSCTPIRPSDSRAILKHLAKKLEKARKKALDKARKNTLDKARKKALDKAHERATARVSRKHHKHLSASAP